MPIPQYWHNACPRYKQKLRDWLGEMAFNEFLRHIRPDLSLDVISDWWDWSLREGRKSLQYIFQELAQMVRDYDPVYWSDEIVPSVYSALPVQKPVVIPFIEQPFAAEDLYSPCEFHNNQQEEAGEYNILQITQTQTPYFITPDSQGFSQDFSQEGFSLECFSQPDLSQGFSQGFSQQSFSQDFSQPNSLEDEEPEFNIHVTPSQITHVLRKKRFRPSFESRNFYIRPFRRPLHN